MAAPYPSIRTLHHAYAGRTELDPDEGPSPTPAQKLFSDRCRDFRVQSEAKKDFQSPARRTVLGMTRIPTSADHPRLIASKLSDIIVSMKQLLLRVPEDLHRRLAARAAREGRSMNAVAGAILDASTDADLGSHPVLPHPAGAPASQSSRPGDPQRGPRPR